MLNFIRQYRGVFMILVVLVAVAMVLSLGLGTTMNQSGGWGATVAKVEGESISKREVLMRLQYQMAEMEQTMAEQLKTFGATPENQKFLEQLMRSQISPERVLNQMIQEKYQVRTSEDLGYVAAKKAVRYDIEQSPDFQSNGKFDPLVYKARTGNEPGRYEKGVRNKVKYMTFASAFQNLGSMWSPLELEQEKKLATVRVFEVLEINPSSFPEPKLASQADIETFLKDPNSKLKLEDHYNRNIKEYRKGDQVWVRHILIKGEGAEKKLKEIKKDILSGKITFEEAAKKYSEDASNASKGGDLGYFGWGAMQAPFEKAAFALKAKKDISEPIQTSFGYHLIRLEDSKILPGGDLESKKREIAGELVLEKLRKDRAEKWLKDYALSQKSPSSDELKKYSLKWVDSAAWKPSDDSLTPIGNVGESLDAFVSLKQKGQMLGEPLRIGDKIYLIKLKSIEEPSLNVATEKAADPKKTGSKTEAPKPDIQVALADAKVRDTLNFYLVNRYKELEKRKKIVRYDDALEEIKSAVAPQQPNGG